MMEKLSPIEREILNEIDSSTLMEFNREIAKEVRLSGSEEELRAFKFSQRTLESFGLETELTFHEAFISIPLEARLIAGGISIPCITHAMAPCTKEDGFIGSPVYLGEFSSEKLKLCNGKIAVVEGIALPEVLIQLEAANAIGAIFINGPYTHEMIVSTVWGSPTNHNIYDMPNIPAISINDTGGMKLRALMDNGTEEVEIHTKVDTKWTPIPTLTAELKGNDESDHFVLFSGHIDSWHYGAMDNGSANATMLEIARVLSKYKGKLRRSLRFAFWSGHSHGRYAGSQNYSDLHWEDLHDNCAIHFYVDSVGGKGATILSESNCMAETKDIAAFYVNEITGQNYSGSRYGRYADQSFWGAGVPSLFMGMSEQPLSADPMSQKVFKLFAGKEAGGFGWWWHTVEDTIDKIDPTNLKRDCEVYALSIFKVLTSPILPINQLAAVRELRKILAGYQESAGDRVSLDLVMERLEKLEKILTDIKLDAQSYPDQTRKEINKTIMALSRYLVPLNYVGCDFFEHDRAAGTQPIPSLASVAHIAEVEMDSHEFYLLRNSLNRQINKVNYLLKQSIEEAGKLQSIIGKRSGEHAKNEG